jgi:hypothetical protein
MEILCLYKEKWIISYIIVTIILTFILNTLQISPQLQSQINGIYLIVHIYIVSFYKVNECAKFRLK